MYAAEPNIPMFCPVPYKLDEEITTEEWVHPQFVNVSDSIGIIQFQPIDKRCMNPLIVPKLWQHRVPESLSNNNINVVLSTAPMN